VCAVADAVAIPILAWLQSILVVIDTINLGGDCSSQSAAASSAALNRNHVESEQNKKLIFIHVLSMG
jgi:hypothetical protein